MCLNREEILKCYLHLETAGVKKERSQLFTALHNALINDVNEGVYVVEGVKKCVERVKKIENEEFAIEGVTVEELLQMDGLSALEKERVIRDYLAITPKNPLHSSGYYSFVIERLYTVLPPGSTLHTKEHFYCSLVHDAIKMGVYRDVAALNPFESYDDCFDDLEEHVEEKLKEIDKETGYEAVSHSCKRVVKGLYLYFLQKDFPDDRQRALAMIERVMNFAVKKEGIAMGKEIRSCLKAYIEKFGDTDSDPVYFELLLAEFQSEGILTDYYGEVSDEVVKTLNFFVQKRAFKKVLALLQLTGWSDRFNASILSLGGEQ